MGAASVLSPHVILLPLGHPFGILILSPASFLLVHGKNERSSAHLCYIPHWLFESGASCFPSIEDHFCACQPEDLRRPTQVFSDLRRFPRTSRRSRWGRARNGALIPSSSI